MVKVSPVDLIFCEAHRVESMFATYLLSTQILYAIMLTIPISHLFQTDMLYLDRQTSSCIQLRRRTLMRWCGSMGHVRPTIDLEEPWTNGTSSNKGGSRRSWPDVR